MAVVHILFVLFTGLLLRNSASAQENSSTPGVDGGGGVGRSDWDMFTNGLQVMFSAYQTCEKQEDMVSCLKLRALKSADRALRLDKVPLIGGLSFVKEESRSGRQMADALPQVDEEKLPVEKTDRQRAIDELLVDRLDRFFNGHSLQMDTGRLLGDPGELDEEDGDEEGLGEGRKRKGLKKYGGALLLGLMMKGGLMAMAWKAVALMAAKALMVAKIALVLSAVVALKKLSHGGHGEEKVTYEIVKHPHVTHSQTYSTEHEYGGHFDSSGGGGGGGGHYKRSLTPVGAPVDAHALAYHAHVHPHVRTRVPYPHARTHRHQHARYHYPAPEQPQQEQQEQQLQQPPPAQQDFQYDDEHSQNADLGEQVQPVYPYPQQ